MARYMKIYDKNGTHKWDLFLANYSEVISFSGGNLQNFGLSFI